MLTRNSLEYLLQFRCDPPMMATYAETSWIDIK